MTYSIFVSVYYKFLNSFICNIIKNTYDLIQIFLELSNTFTSTYIWKQMQKIEKGFFVEEYDFDRKMTKIAQKNVITYIIIIYQKT